MLSKYRQMRAARDNRRHKTQNKNDITTSLCSDALNNPDSELSRFLFMQDSNNSNNNDTGNSASISSELPSIRSNRGWCYCLSLESLQVRRSERVVMMFEANALFSALFLSGTWVKVRVCSLLCECECSIRSLGDLAILHLNFLCLRLIVFTNHVHCHTN